MRTLLLTEHTELTLGGKKTKQSSRSQRENTIPAEKERGERERSGEEEPQKVHIQGREKDRENPNQPCSSLAPNSLKAFHVCTWGGKKAVAVGREKKPLCERERESKQEPSREDKIPKKKASKIRSPNSKTLHREFPCTELCPQKKHTHKHKEGFFFLLPNYARKKRKQKKKKKKKQSRRRRVVEFAVLTNGGEGTRHT
jgi:hypothetical protein